MKNWIVAFKGVPIYWPILSYNATIMCIKDDALRNAVYGAKMVLNAKSIYHVLNRQPYRQFLYAELTDSTVIKDVYGKDIVPGRGCKILPVSECSISLYVKYQSASKSGHLYAKLVAVKFLERLERD